jgi:hypothetical protein
MAKQVLLKVTEGETLSIETDFSEEEIQDCMNVIEDDIRDEASDRGLEPYGAEADAKILEVMQQKGYFKVLGPGPEIYDLNTF